MKKRNWKKGCIVGLWFGGFHGLMPCIGYLLGVSFQQQIEAIDHWIAFFLLVFIGINMVKNALSKEEEEADCSLKPKKMLVLAIATSIDALAVGVSLAFLKVNIISASLLIACTTFIISALGVWFGNIFGLKYKSKAELAGGIILIFLGIKILVEHTLLS